MIFSLFIDIIMMRIAMVLLWVVVVMVHEVLGACSDEHCSRCN